MSEGFNRLAIANRGEVAVRIINACKELGISTVLLAADFDKHTLAHRMADQVYSLGSSTKLADTYLNIEKNIAGALKMGAQALHPGFGFLSENAHFARKCRSRGLVFVGPSVSNIETFGDKVLARKFASSAGGAVPQAFTGTSTSSIEQYQHAAKELGFPVMLKLAAGGGGRGLKIAHSAQELPEALRAARAEGMAAFGSSKVFMEKFLPHAKHIEVQVFGISHKGKFAHTVVLGERDCSVQFRHQKLIEMSPSPVLSLALRAQVCQQALRIMQKAQYLGAGTVEFLFCGGEFYFLEVNTRLQVEHGVTELTHGVDLVKAQILEAQGRGGEVLETWRSMGIKADSAQNQPRGFAIECRVCAQNPVSLLPSAGNGKILCMRWPLGAGRRFDSGFEAGDRVSPFCDPMFAKVLVWGETFAVSHARMLSTLSDSVVLGVETNMPLLQKILLHPDFMQHKEHTQFIKEHGKALKSALKQESFADKTPPELTKWAHAVRQKLQPANTRPSQKPNPFVIC